MTARNTERSGKRCLSRLSTVARTIADVRHCDIDLVQVCPRCKEPQLFAEVKKHPVYPAEWEYMRIHADRWQNNCMAVLFVEQPSLTGIQVYTSHDRKTGMTAWGDDSLIVRVLEKARDMHRCRVGSPHDDEDAAGEDREENKDMPGVRRTAGSGVHGDAEMEVPRLAGPDVRDPQAAPRPGAAWLG